MKIKSILMLSMYLVPFILILTLPLSPWLMLLFSVVIGIGLAGTGMSVMHDAMHGSFSRKKWLNDLMSNTMYLLGGSVFTWKVQHNILHHTFTNIDGHDEDIASKAIIRLSRHAPLHKVHRFQHLYALFLYSLMTLSKLFKDFPQLHHYNKTGLTRQQNASPAKELIKLSIAKALYLGVFVGLPFLLTDFSWWQILLGFLLTHLTAGMIMSVVFQMAHIVEGASQPLLNEEGNVENEWAIHQLDTTANFARRSRWLNWYTGGLNFQIEHHLFPNICHIHYRQISPIVERTAAEFGIVYNIKPTFAHAFASHLRMLKQLGRAEEEPVAVPVVG